MRRSIEANEFKPEQERNILRPGGIQRAFNQLSVLKRGKATEDREQVAVRTGRRDEVARCGCQRAIARMAVRPRVKQGFKLLSGMR